MARRVWRQVSGKGSTAIGLVDQRRTLKGPASLDDGAAAVGKIAFQKLAHLLRNLVLGVARHVLMQPGKIAHFIQQACNAGGVALIPVLVQFHRPPLTERCFGHQRPRIPRSECL